MPEENNSVFSKSDSLKFSDSKVHKKEIISNDRELYSQQKVAAKKVMKRLKPRSSANHSKKTNFELIYSDLKSKERNSNKGVSLGYEDKFLVIKNVQQEIDDSISKNL